MDSKLLLVKVITLLYKESLLESSSDRSTVLANEIINQLKLPEAGADFDRSRDSLVALRTTALWMIEAPDNTKYDRTTLLQRIRVNVSSDDWLYEAFKHVIEQNVDEETLKQQIISGRRELRDYQDQSKITEIMQRNARRLAFQPETVPDLRSYVREVARELEPFISNSEHIEIDSYVDGVDFSDTATLAKLFEKGQAETSSDGIMRLGYQGINRMLGEHRGFRRGETISIGALQHNYKSGLALSFFKQIALYNTPWMRDPKKKPALVRISFENELHLDILWLYKSLKENETLTFCDLNAVKLLSTDEQLRFYQEAADYVMSKLTATGYHVIMHRWEGPRTSYHDVFDFISNLESQGYEVHLLALDYLGLMSRRGCDESNSAHGFRDLWRRMRGFCAARGITLLSPAQLSPAAKMLVRGNVEDLVREVANKGYYDGATSIDQELDLEFYCHIVKVNGRSYLTVQRGKHRGLMNPTPERDMYCVLPFEDIGGIRDDIFGKDTSTRHAGGGAIGSSDETPWFAG